MILRSQDRLAYPDLATVGNDVEGSIYHMLRISTASSVWIVDRTREHDEV